MRIAVILPERYRGGTLRGAKNIARMLRLGAVSAGESVHISFGYIDDPALYSSDDFEELLALGIACRPFRIEKARSEDLNPYLVEWFKLKRSAPTPHYVLFNDGISNFEDCDFWLIVSDRVSAPVPPHRRYAVVVYDYIQRYVPEIFGTTPATELNWLHFETYARFARSADFIVCTTEQTRMDCLSVAGTEPGRVHVFPMEFDPLESPGLRRLEGQQPDLHGLWTTNTTEHKNHLNVIKGLEKYFIRNPESKLTIRISGVYTELFSSRSKGRPHYDNDYIALVRRILEESPTLRNRVVILGNVSDAEYISNLQTAQFCLHAAKYDNGTYSVLEAAWHSVPSISADYPAMREMASRFSVPLAFFDAFSPESLACAIENVLQTRQARVASLPSRQHLKNFSFDATASQYWACFKQALGT